MKYIKIKFSDGKVRKVPFIEPMRPEDIAYVPDGDWVAEEKKDGSLTLMYLEDGAVAYINRRGVNKTFTYPEMVIAPKNFRNKKLTIIQGEAYVGRGGMDSFEKFLSRDLIKNTEKAKERAKEYPLEFDAFDTQMVEGKLTSDKPLLERKKLLAEKLPKHKRIHLTKFRRDHKEFSSELRKDKTVEGVVFKKIPDKYESGRSDDWRKIKFTKEADVVVIGYNKGEGRRGDIGALRTGVYDKKTGKIREVANVGVGFSDKDIADYKKRLDKGKKIFGKVRYLKVGSQGKLRAPVWLGERKDITIKETGL